MNHRHQDRRVRLKIVVSNLRLRSHGKPRRLRSGPRHRAQCVHLWNAAAGSGTAVPVVCHATAVAGSVVTCTTEFGDIPDQALFGACTFDHDGCVVCSDAGIPVRVVALDGDDALCEDAAGNRAQIAVELVAPVRVGDTLLVHGGVAIGRTEQPTSAG